MSLERLILKDFPSLAEIDCSIGKLARLIYLKIKWCPRLRELPQEIGCLTALRELILIQGCSVCYLPDSIGNLRLLSRLTMKNTGLVELPDTIKGLVDLEHLCLENCRSLNSLSDAVGELESLTHLDLSGTTIEELPPSLWNLERLMLWMSCSKIETRLMRYRPLMDNLEHLLETGESLGPDGPFKSEMFCVFLPGYPMEILARERRTIAVPGFHEHHLSGRCPPKISARMFFLHGDASSINISVEVPLWDNGFMSSSEPFLYLQNLILMLVSWLERKWVSKWMHDFQREEVALHCLEFCNHCMCITSENRGFSPSPPCLEGSDQFPQLFITFQMTLYEPGHSHQIGCPVKHLEFVTKPSLPIALASLLLPWSRKRLLRYIELWNLSEKATEVQHLASRRSLKNCMSPQRRNTHRDRLRAERKRNLFWSCFCINT